MADHGNPTLFVHYAYHGIVSKVFKTRLQSSLTSLNVSNYVYSKLTQEQWFCCMTVTTSTMFASYLAASSANRRTSAIFFPMTIYRAFAWHRKRFDKTRERIEESSQHVPVATGFGSFLLGVDDNAQLVCVDTSNGRLADDSLPRLGSWF